jgi:formylglycine-generating enzyme required for sulfatase activity
MSRAFRLPVLPALGLSALCAALAVQTEPGRTAPAPHVTRQFTNSVGMKLARVPAGKLVVGSPAGEVGRGRGEEPHEVQLSRPFFLGVYEVTQAQYQKVMGTNPSHFCPTGPGRAEVGRLDTKDFPVDTVTWDDAVAFCKKLSTLPAEWSAGRAYRLPTSAEWEHACRAGSSTPFHFGNSLSSKQANFNGNYSYGGGARGPALGRTTKVGSYRPNALGLYDLHGNVWEWCSDWYQEYSSRDNKRDPKGPLAGTTRAVRGGSWSSDGSSCRAAFRLHYVPGNRSISIGFRVACDAPRPR